jgi:tRNA 2-thiouridine synthesizing protein A
MFLHPDSASSGPAADPSDDALPVRELYRLAGGRCRDCARPYTAREAVGSVALGFKDAPRCLPCLTDRLGRAEADLRADLVHYARRRECYARAWAIAERLDGPSPDWPALVEPRQSPAAGSSSLEPVDSGPEPAGAWDAGDMGCGELVLALRGRLNALPPGAVLQVTATDPAAPEDLPAWCRLTGNPLIDARPPVYLIRRKER